MKRREFIGIAAGGAAASLVWPTSATASDTALARPRLLDVLRDERLVRELGQRYRAMVPAEDDARALVGAILPETKRGSGSSLRARLDEHVRSDFTAGRTVTVKGWIISVTEARQCALYSLQPA